MPDYLSWIEYISWFRYSFEIAVVNQWDGVQNITCPGLPVHGLCPQPDGAAVIRQLGMSKVITPNLQ